ncbi:DNA excision repair protein ERCC-8-like [Amphibalanus amphitrite]|uniref:DNA excision repair protein ERCC-8-like n=1 Tax=Amphibalanus amphitrite TaxID=1232801 RepID=UPI001C909F81|nr:DNA excision repair protein ERCC-8-like [Amphibalanus amphitrite]
MFYLQNNHQSLVSLLGKHCLGLTAHPSGREDELLDWWREKFELSRCSDVRVQSDSYITCLALEDIEQRYLLSGANNGNIFIHDLFNLAGTHHHAAEVVAKLDRETGQGGHRSAVADVSWYPLDTGLFLSSGSDGNLHVWDTNSMTKSESFRFKNKLICHAMSPVATAHSLIAVGGEESTVTLCDLRSGSNTHQLRGHAAATVDTCRWSPAHHYLLATGGRDKRILFWDVRYAKSQLASLVRSQSRPDGAHRAPVAGLRFLADGRHLVSVGRDGACAVWDLLTGRPRQLTVPPLRLAAANSAGLGCQLAVTTHGRRQLAFLPCGDQVVTCDLSSGEPVQRLDGHLRPVTACQYDRREGRLITSAADGQVLVWTAQRAAPPAEDGVREGGERTNGNNADHLMRDEWSDDD